jgi:hypothetical protein
MINTQEPHRTHERMMKRGPMDHPHQDLRLMTDGTGRAWCRGILFTLTEEEKQLPIEAIFDIMEDHYKRDLHRCSTCGKEIQRSKAHFWLFAALVCDDCNAKELARTKTEGTCRMCGKKYSWCCC